MRKFLLTLTVVGAALALGAPADAAAPQATVQTAVFAHPATVTAAHDLVQPVQYRHRRRHYRRHHRS